MAETDSPGRLPRKAAEFEEIARLPTAAEYEAVNKPYQAPKEKLPTMSENWAYAMRRYGRYQGYSYLAMGGAAVLALALSRLTGTEIQTATRQPERAGGQGPQTTT